MGQIIQGKDDFLLPHIIQSVNSAAEIRLLSAFIMESGVKLLGTALRDASRRGAEIKILTGKYLSITEPSAIYFLKDILGESAQIRFYSDPVRSFHPKSYIFDGPNGGEAYIGSSNISRSALTHGLEWNYKIDKTTDPQNFKKFLEAFDLLFDNSGDPVTDETLREYAASWKKPRFSRIADKVAESALAYDFRNITVTTTEPQPVVEPRGTQIEALYELRKAREEGITKGMVVAATGVGKTYIAAFDSLNFRKVLFVAHREEILRQAKASFEKVRPNSICGFYGGPIKEARGDICCAMVQTLSQDKNLEQFAPDYFDYIVIDEFHHAAADSYLKAINHFKPKFLLGLTATPYRLDNRDIYAICDNNVIYEIYLKDAINRDLLVPFRYYGIYDPTDYDKIDFKNGAYVVEHLERELSNENRAELIFSHYRKFSANKALGFCVSIAHAEFMAEYFSKQGVPSAAVHSGQSSSRYWMDRKQAVQLLASGGLKVIFAVDIFNEGVDIPSVEMVMFLRPTESYVVFLQQLGRGLRKFQGKEYLTVLDFIGNYKKAHYVPALLAGENPMRQRKTGSKEPQEQDYPEGCFVQFDFKLLDLFKEMAKHDPLAKRMRDEYFRLKRELGGRPGRLDIYEGTDIPMREFVKGGWLGFLHRLGELLPEEENWLGTPAEKLLKLVEKTLMTKSYKIPVIASLINEDGTVCSRVTLDVIAKNFESFFVDNSVHQKDLHDKSNRGWRKWETKQFGALARKNPVYFLSKGEFFNYDEVNKVFYLDEELKPYLSATLGGHIVDILAWRERDYFRKRFKNVDED